MLKPQSNQNPSIMGFSTSSSSIFPQANIFFSNRNLRHSSIKPLLLSNAQIKKLPTNPFPKFKLLNSSKPLKTITQLPKENNLQRVLVEKAVGFVMGSVIFIGCFNVATKPAMAFGPIQTNTSAQNREESQYSEEQEFMYERLLMREPKNMEALKVVLFGKMKKGKFQEALTYVERLAELEPEEFEWRLLMALCCELMGQWSKAKRLFKEILEERPLFLRALHGLALVMHKNHDGAEVFVMLDKALKIAQSERRIPEERDIKILIAQMHLMSGHLEEALKGFKTLTDEDYRDFRPYLCLGIVYSLMDKKKEAEEQFEIYQSLVPEEFPDRKFLDDIVIAAKTKSREHLLKEYRSEFSGMK